MYPNTCCSDLNLELLFSLAGEDPSFSSVEGRCWRTSPEKKAYHRGINISIKLFYCLYHIFFFFFSDWKNSYFKSPHLCLQFSKGATETGHICHRQDPTDLHAARLVQSDPGAAAVLWRQEEPGNKSDNEDRSDLQQGQLCLSRRSNAELRERLLRLWRNSLTFLETHYFAYSLTFTLTMVSRSHLSRFCNMSALLFCF